MYLIEVFNLVTLLSEIIYYNESNSRIFITLCKKINLC